MCHISPFCNSSNCTLFLPDLKVPLHPSTRTAAVPGRTCYLPLHISGTSLTRRCAPACTSPTCTYMFPPCNSSRRGAYGTSTTYLVRACCSFRTLLCLPPIFRNTELANNETCIHTIALCTSISVMQHINRCRGGLWHFGYGIPRNAVITTKRGRHPP